MRCLVVGGTGFLGGAITDALARSGHEVVVLTRGTTERELPKGVQAIHADRHAELDDLISEDDFDWAFDTCAFSPDAVVRLLSALGPSLKRYVLISSISAYGTFDRPGLTEVVPVPDASQDDLALVESLTPEQRGSAMAYGASYGPLKRACEKIADEYLGDRVTILRVGLLVGAGDYTDRLTWWVRRIDMARDDRVGVPAPAPPTRPVQLIDVCDAADFALHCATNELGGIWNVTGKPMPLAHLLNAVAKATGSRAELVWVDESALAAAEITPWTDMPLMVPAAPSFRHFLEIDATRARAAGLQARPLTETLGPLVAWDRGRRDQVLKGGLTESQEEALFSR